MSSNIRAITGKKIKVGIKNGQGIQDFCKKYECSPDELWFRIGQLFTVKDTAKQIWGDLGHNDKKRHKSRTKETVTVTDVTQPPTGVEEVTVAEVTDDSHAPTLEELKAAEAELSDAVIELENLYKDCHQQREQGRETYRQLRDEMRDLKRQYEIKGQAAKKIIQTDNQLVDQMNAACSAHKVKQEALEEIRHQIKEMSKIVICVYSSREIALLDEAVEISLSDTGHEDLFNQLREQEEAEDFRPKDLRFVAKIIQIVRNLGGVPVEFAFEDDEIKKAYEVFTKSP